MERAGLARIDDDRCAHLRWKGMFIPAEWDAPYRCSTATTAHSGATKRKSHSGPMGRSSMTTNATKAATASKNSMFALNRRGSFCRSIPQSENRSRCLPLSAYSATNLFGNYPILD